MQHLHIQHSVLRRCSGKTPRAFTAVELVVSVAVFLAVATFITVVISTSLGGAAQADRARAGSEVAFDQLTALSSNTYADVLANDFTVPAVCSTSDANAGVAGLSCVSRPAGDVRVKYYYADEDGNCPDIQADPEAVSPVTGSAQAVKSGEITVCAIPLNRDDTPDSNAIMQSTTFVAPWENYDPSRARIRVLLSTNLPAPPSAVYLVRSQNPSQQVAGTSPATFEDSVAEFEINPATQCSPTDPCQVALAPGSSSPSLLSGTALFGTAATPAANIAPQAGEVSVVELAAAAPSSFSVDLVTSKGGTPLDNTVCLSAQLTSAPDYPIFECNTGSTVTFETVDVNGFTYPIAPSESATVFLDTPDGTCPANGRTVDASGNWSTARVCTSWTWGSTASLPTTVVAPATVTVLFDRFSPANGFRNFDSWTTPRLTPGCVATGLCAPVTNIPELELCGGEPCLSGTP